ncbi:hypothetical protein pclt_cds_33 [Pandoravirus celtis]|uniref:Uncharacterized protein n=1 Tax=Pandoravirus celtis TaxID=2568002 RepID=A0A4D6EGX5_9VIRU|nr:hypothetical protein pclt_cds_33 [Pandoravirus celtis]
MPDTWRVDARRGSLIGRRRWREWPLACVPPPQYRLIGGTRPPRRWPSWAPISGTWSAPTTPCQADASRGRHGCWTRHARST